MSQNISINTGSVSNTNTKEILELVASGSITAEQAEKLITETKALNNIYLKLSEKGCISFYGIRRMPISLYPDELHLILKYIVKDYKYTETFSKFLTDNDIHMNIVNVA